MRRHRAFAVTMAVLIVTGAGCSSSASSSSVSRPAAQHPAAHHPAAQHPAAHHRAGIAASVRARPCPPALPAHRREPAPWPSRTVLRESPMDAGTWQVVDPAAGAVFLLAAATNPPGNGPWVLCRISLATGAARLGQTFQAGDLALASGYLWTYSASGTITQPVVVSQVSPVTLARIRPILLPRAPANFGLPATVTAGPEGSVWIGYYRTLLRVDAATGHTLARITLPPGLAAGADALATSGTTLYASATHVAKDGGMAGLVMLEYNARSGRKLAEASGGLLRYSVAGADLTAVPGGVWASFRTGMMGLTIHLGANGLPMLTPPGPHIGLTPPTGVFHWPMGATTSYGGGALWVASQASVVACLDPRTGTVRASEHLPRGQFISGFEAIDPASRTIFFAFGYGGGLLQVTPPRRCWH
jgi:hypothetical protein